MTIIDKSQLIKIGCKRLYESTKFDVIELNGSPYIAEKDTVVCLPYFIEDSHIMLKYNAVEPFNYTLPVNLDNKFLNVLTTQIADGEKDVDTIRRGLTEQFGIKLNDGYQINVRGSLFMNTNNTSKATFVILPITSLDYEQVKPTDETLIKMKNENMKIPTNIMDNLQITDILTKYITELLKKDYNL